MTEQNFHGDDLIGKPPDDAVLLKRMGSWNVLFSHEEQSLYIVPTDYHPEPLKLHKRELHQIKKTMKSISDAARKKAKASKEQATDEDKA
jgi:hypothetical protein